MLPTSTLERLAATRGIRFHANSGEKRDSIRLPLRAAAHLHLIEHRLIRELVRVVLKDISLSGAAVLLPKGLPVPDEWIVWTGREPATSKSSLTLVCRTTRVTDAGPSLRLLGARIEAMLAPGQVVVTGRLLPGYEWLPTLTSTPEDPFQPPLPAPANIAVPLRAAEDISDNTAAA